MIIIKIDIVITNLLLRGNYQIILKQKNVKSEGFNQREQEKKNDNNDRSENTKNKIFEMSYILKKKF